MEASEQKNNKLVGFFKRNQRNASAIIVSKKEYDDYKVSHHEALDNQGDSVLFIELKEVSSIFLYLLSSLWTQATEQNKKLIAINATPLVIEDLIKCCDKNIRNTLIRESLGQAIDEGHPAIENYKVVPEVPLVVTSSPDALPSLPSSPVRVLMQQLSM